MRHMKISIIIFRKLTAVVFLLSVCALSTGCATMFLNDGISKGVLKNHYDKNKFCVPEESRFCHPTMEKGYFKGITKRFGRQYYTYVVPDVFTKSLEDDGLEITLPVSPDNKRASIKMVDAVEKNDKVVYVIFYDRNIYKDDPSRQEQIPAWECSSGNPFREVSDIAVSPDYPTLIFIGIPELSSGAQIRAGIRMNIAELSNVAEELKKYMCVKCPQTGFTLATSIQPEASRDDACQLWYWSEIYESNSYRSMSAAGYNTLRVLGHLVTVPFDILTSPIQLTAYILLGPEYRHKISGQ